MNTASPGGHAHLEPLMGGAIKHSPRPAHRPAKGPYVTFTQDVFILVALAMHYHSKREYLRHVYMDAADGLIGGLPPTSESKSERARLRNKELWKLLKAEPSHARGLNQRLHTVFSTPTPNKEDIGYLSKLQQAFPPG